MFWAANGLNELREVRSKLIGKKTIFFNRPNMVRKPNLGTEVGTQSKDFGVVSAMMQATQARFEIFSSTPLLYPNFPQVLPLDF